MSSLATNIIIGAALSGNFNSTVGSAVAGIGQINQSVGQLGGAMLQVGQAWASLRAIGAAVGIASDLEHELMQAGITADMTNEQIAGLKTQLRGLAVPDRTNQSMQDLLKGFTALVSAGMDKDKASAMLEALGRTATASQASMDDLAKTAFVLNDTLGVAPDGMGKALDQLAFAGKQGAFELKDMARYFPVLGASAKAMGLQGTEAVTTLGAALQIAKKGAGDPSEAANNMKNFMAKMTAGETVERFAKHGVNLKKVFSDALAKGQNPMEVVLAKIQDMTKGNQFKLQELFNDQQVLDFLKPMLANMEEYKKLKAEIAGSSGTVDTDFARMMETNKELLKGFNTQLNKLGEAVGSALLPPFNMALKAITPVVTVLGDMANASPATTAAIVAVGAAVTLLPPAITLATVAWKAFSTSIVASPIGLAIGAVAIGAGLIIDNWSAVKGFFTDLWGGVVAGFDAVVGFFSQHGTTILKFMGPIGYAASAIIENWSAVSAALAPVWDTVLTAWDTAVGAIMALWDKVSGPLKAVGEFLGIGAPVAAFPMPGAADKAANDNPSNDNIAVGSGVKQAEARGALVVGSGVAAAEAKGKQMMGEAAGSGQMGGQAVAAGGGGFHRMELVITLPPGVAAEVKGKPPGWDLHYARTGQTMVGGN